MGAHIINMKYSCQKLEPESDQGYRSNHQLTGTFKNDTVQSAKPRLWEALQGNWLYFFNKQQVGGSSKGGEGVERESARWRFQKYETSINGSVETLK